MTNNDLFYVCSLIEYIARQTKNKRKVVVDCLGIEGIKKQLHDASVNHCLSFEQVGDEVINDYKIPMGNFDSISNCKYKVPSFQDIGKLYAIVVESSVEKGDLSSEVMNVFSSFIQRTRCSRARVFGTRPRRYSRQSTLHNTPLVSLQRRCNQTRHNGWEPDGRRTTRCSSCPSLTETTCRYTVCRGRSARCNEAHAWFVGTCSCSQRRCLPKRPPCRQGICDVP